MKFLFICSIFPDYSELSRESIAPPQMAGIKVCTALAQGLYQHLGDDFSILNMPYVSPYPTMHKMARVPSYQWSFDGRKQMPTVRYWNFFGFSQFSRKRSLKKRVRNWVKTHASEELGILIYSLSTPFLCAGREAKRLRPDIRYCQLIPDLPQYMVANPSPLYTFLKKIDILQQNRMLHLMDFSVSMTKYIPEALHIEDRPWIVMEGITGLCESDARFDDSAPDGLKHIVYSGGIDDAYGIFDLLQAFSLLSDPDTRLDITGKGGGVQRVLAWQQKDARVRYHGIVSFAELERLQRSATVLVNPRQSSEEATRYAFPSKVLEYMTTGRPTITHKLSGIPDEYDPYLVYFDGVTPEAMARTIQRVFDMPEAQRQKIGEAAAHFILANKNKTVQTRRILSLMFPEKDWDQRPCTSGSRSEPVLEWAEKGAPGV